jgi:hypothetical protein
MLEIQPAPQLTSTPDSPRSSGTIDEIVADIFRNRRIDKATQQGLMHALLSKAELSSKDKAQVQRVFDAVHQGRLRVVD